jgi:hypothetical protein
VKDEWERKWKYAVMVSILKTWILAYFGVLRKPTKDFMVAGVQLSSELGTF